MKRIWHLTLMIWVGLLSGCATFDHQVGPSEAHGILCFAVPNLDASAYRRPYRIDGSRLRPNGNTVFRVTPGRHEIVFEDMQIEVERNTPNTPHLGIGYGRQIDEEVLEYSPETGLRSRPCRPLRLWAERRVVTMVTNTVEVKAGWEYRLDGWSVTGQPIRPAPVPAADGATSGSAPPSARPEIFEAIRAGDLGAVRRLLDEDPSRANLRTVRAEGSHLHIQHLLPDDRRGGPRIQIGRDDNQEVFGLRDRSDKANVESGDPSDPHLSGSSTRGFIPMI